MKDLVESLKESLVEDIQTVKLNGKHFVKAVAKELYFDENINCDGWNLSSFEVEDGSVIWAYWSKKSEWIYYHVDNAEVGGDTNWAAFAPAEIKPAQYNDKMFKDFDDLLMNGATIPMFDKFETNLEK